MVPHDQRQYTFYSHSHGNANVYKEISMTLYNTVTL